MATIINDVLPLLDSADSDVKRKGAIEAVVCIVDKLQFDIVPYIVLLIIPLLGKLNYLYSYILMTDNLNNF